MRTLLLICALAALATPALTQEDDLFWLGNEDQEPVPHVPVVTGLRPAGSTVITGEELLRRGYRTLGDALADVVGVDVQRTTLDRRYGMRGIPDGLTLVVDGVPQVVDGERDILDVDEGIDVADIERVEIIRGPVSAINGVSALSGVVRVTTRQPGLTSGRLRIGATHLGEREVNGAATGRSGDFALRVALLHREGPSALWHLDKIPTRFIRINRAIVPSTKVNTDITLADDATTAARISAVADDLQLDFSFARTDLHTPISSFSHGLLDRGPQQRRLRERQRLRLMWFHQLGPLHVELTAYGARHLRTDRIILYPPRGLFAEGGSITTDGEATTTGVVLRADVPLHRNHRLVLGSFADLARQWAHTDAVDPKDGKKYPRLVTLDDLNATATTAAEYQGDFGFGLHLTAGAAVEWRTSYGFAFVPRAAVIYLPQTWLSLRLAYAEGSRTPDRYDLSAITQAVVAGSVLGAAANNKLLPEHSRTGEFAVRFEPSSRLQSELDIFVTRHENAIETQIVNARMMPTNLDPRLVAGGELSATIEALPSLLTFSASGAIARTLSGPALENHLLILRASTEITPIDGFGFGARARASLREAEDAAAGGSAITEVYSSYQPLEDRLILTAAIRNAFDGREMSPDTAALAGSPDIGVPIPARVFFMSLEGRL